MLVPWPGKALGSGERREVRVRVETEAGLGEWSAPLVVEAGLLDPDDWSAAWVSTGAEAGAAGHRPAYRLRGEVTVDEPVVRARLYATAHGIYEASIDGQRVGTRRADAGLHGVRVAHAGADLRRHGPAGARQPRGRGVARRRLVPRPGRHAQRPRPVGHRDGVPRAAPPRARGRHHHRRRHRRDVALGDVAHHRDRPDRGSARGPPAARRRARLVAGRGERARVRRPRLLARPARAARRGAAPGVGHVGARRRVRRRPRPEHQRPGAADLPRPGRHPHHVDAR